MTIEIMPFDYTAMKYPTIAMNEDGEVVEQAEFAYYLSACRWVSRMRRKHGGRIIDHTPLPAAH